MRLLLRRFSARQLPGGLLLALLCTAMAGPEFFRSQATTLTVTSTADSGAGSLRAAIAAASDGDTIQFDVALNGQTISLTSAELAIDKSITISGPGSNLLTVSRSSGTFRIFHVMPSRTVIMGGLTISGGNGAPNGSGVLNDHATLTMDGCTVQNNFAQFNQGGGIYNDGSGGSATLNILNSTVSSNGALGGTGGGIYNDASNSGSAILTILNSIVNSNGATLSSFQSCSGYGGGIYNGGGTLTITNSIVSNNGAGTPSGPPFPCGYGGGIWNSGALTITNSILKDNWAGLEGGGIYHYGGTLTISNSTLSGNGASGTHDGQGWGYGGGISNYGALTITNSTISGNYATNSGGGLYRGGIIITNSTLSGNSANQGSGGGIFVWGALEIGNTILKTGASGANISNTGGTVTSRGYNLSSDNGGGFLTATGDQINTDPILGPLQDNGGPTFTHDLLTGSPAIDAGDPNFSPPPLYDQRGSGYDRVVNGRIDIGALEVQPAPTPTPTPTATSTATPTATATPPAPTPTITPNQCSYTFLREDFDGVTAPALPAGWVSSFTPGPANCTPTGTCALGTDWTTSTTNPRTPPNCAFHDDPGCVTDSNLDTPSFFDAITGSILFFEHNYDLESGRDGAVLEISINGGPFIDFVAAGGSFFGGGGYNGTISTAFHSPIAGRPAWTGNSGGYRGAFANMPVAAGNQSVVLRFRLATDCSGAGPGWRLDNISVSFAVPCATPTPSPSPTETPPPTPTATATVTPTATATATPIQTCTPVPVFSENFDGVTAPALPAGWVTSFTPGPADCTPTGTCALGTNWATNTTTPDTAPNCVFHDDPGCVTDSTLDTPSFTSGTFSTDLFFRHSYDLENGFDGAVLEISINGGAFTDIITAGGHFVLPGGYNGTISSGSLSPIAGRPAWTGNSGGYISTRVQMPPTASFQNVRLRFRLATDCSGAGTGWRIDTIRATYPPGCPSPTPPMPTPTPITISGAISYCSNPVPGPVPNVTLTLAGSMSGSTLSDGSGNYTFSSLPSGGSYTVTPTKTALTPGSMGINTVDVVAIQRHFLVLGTPLSGCRLTAADVNLDGNVNTSDVIAIQRFVLGLSTGIANTGKYQFNPASRHYADLVSNQTAQNYDTLILGDVAAPFVGP